jgi:hypothetical protein
VAIILIRGLVEPDHVFLVRQGPCCRPGFGHTGASGLSHLMGKIGDFFSWLCCGCLKDKPQPGVSVSSSASLKAGMSQWRM